MRQCAVMLLLAGALAGTVSACGSNGNNGGYCAGNAVVADSKNNYAFTSALSFPPTPVAPNTELTFDWSGLTKDFVGHALDTGKDINSILVLMWDLTQAELETNLNDDALMQSDLTTVPLVHYTEGGTTSARLFDFTLSGNPIDPTTIITYFDPVAYPPADHIYTLMASTGTALGSGVRMVQSFYLDPQSPNTIVNIDSGSTKLSHTADLHSLTPTYIPAGQAAVTLDWARMKDNALGNTFIAANITSAIVGHYTQTVSELEAQFLDIELIATELYRGTIDTGTTVDFSTLADDTGKKFSGIDETGTWIVALQCGGCRNPAPWYLTVLRPCSAGM